MARTFLIRGMLCGLAAGIVVFLLAKFFGEPSVDGAIGIEEQIAKAAGEAPEPELVSRAVQASWGLFTGTMLYSIAIGGLFSLVFAVMWGRVKVGARSMAALLAAGAFVSVYVVPFLKYPANPPSVGNPETIGYRTALYFGMIVISIAALVAAFNLTRSVAARLDRWHATLIGMLAYVVIVVIAYTVMPSINEVPETFPATLLWQFRLTALGMQFALWTVIGLGFGELTHRSLLPAVSRKVALRNAA